MRDIILVVPKSISLDAIEASLPPGVQSIISEADGRLVVLSKDDEAVEFVRDNSLEQYYELGELEAIAAIGHDLQYYMVHFKDIELLKSVLGSVANRADFIIDNDFGLIIRGDEFVARCNSHPGWDWIPG